VTVKAVEPVAVEPDAVPPQPASEDSPLQGGRVSVEPDTVPPSTGENPLPCGRVSASVLDDI
jgi:hypothetical protein